MWRLKSLTAETRRSARLLQPGRGTQRGEAARGGITGYGIDDEIIEAYTWLIQNFDEGDGDLAQKYGSSPGEAGAALQRCAGRNIRHNSDVGCDPPIPTKFGFRRVACFEMASGLIRPVPGGTRVRIVRVRQHARSQAVRNGHFRSKRPAYYIWTYTP